MAWTQQDTKLLLSETYSSIKAVRNLDPILDFEVFLKDKNLWDEYVDQLSQGLTESDTQLFKAMADNLRIHYLKESFTQGFIPPYERLSLPILRVFWPTLVAKHLVYTDVMEAPEIIRYFLVPQVVKTDGTVINLPYWQDANGNFQTLSKGLSIDVNQEVQLDSTNKSAVVNLKTLAGLTADDDVFCQRNIAIVGVCYTDSNGNDYWNNNVIIEPDVNGRFYQQVEIVDSDGNTHTDILTGEVDFNTCELIVNSTYGVVSKIKVAGSISFATNKYLNRVQITLTKIRIVKEEFGINTTIPVEVIMDAARILDIDLQAELVQIMAAVIANDIDTEILNRLYTAAETFGAAATFSRTRPSNFLMGDLEWQRQIIVKINQLSAAIQQATRIGRGNVLAMNPQDVALLESMNLYKAETNGQLVGLDTSISGGAPEIGKLQNRYTVISSEKIPYGKVLMILKTNDPQTAVFGFFEYIPLYFIPYPLGNIPSITVKYQAGMKLFRPNGLAILNITD